MYVRSHLVEADAGRLSGARFLSRILWVGIGYEMLSMEL